MVIYETKTSEEIMCTCFSISLVIENRSNLISVFCMHKAKACKLWISVIIRSWIPGCCTYYIPQEVKMWLTLWSCTVVHLPSPWQQHHSYHLSILLDEPNLSIKHMSGWRLWVFISTIKPVPIWLTPYRTAILAENERWGERQNKLPQFAKFCQATNWKRF